MVMMAESEMNSHESAEQQGNNNYNKNHSFSSLGRQSSIYSLTLDEFQHTVCENSGKNFSSMNMDEFLSSIWSAEENQGATISETSTIIRKQQQSLLPRQGSLCRKTVDEFWSEIHKGHQSQSQQHNNNVNTDSVRRQPTFGEMTLEDFLVKAGVVREPNNKLLTVGPSFRPVMEIGDRGNFIAPPPYGAIGESKRDGIAGFHAPAYGGRVVNMNVNGGGGVGYGTNMGMAIGHPVSPVSPDQMGTGAVTSENFGGGGGQYGMEVGLLRGRTRGSDGFHVEKVVERRQKRMIKNRESAARSRARKQAYTIELEAELNQLKEENAQLKLALAELERRRKRKLQCLEEGNERVHANGQNVKRKLSSLRRNLSF